MQIGKAGNDPRMLFSWYSGDYCTDPAFADLPPEQRANPSMASWPDGTAIWNSKRRRLPTGRYRRLHLNLPGSPEGSAFDMGAILKCVVTGRSKLQRVEGVHYTAAVDMSHGSKDDCCLAITHMEGRISVVDFVARQLDNRKPFDAAEAARYFAGIIRSWGIAKVGMDAAGGETYRKIFERDGIEPIVVTTAASELYERLEPKINQREVELLDVSMLIEQAVGLVWRGQKITHEPNMHDDLINSVALAIDMMHPRDGIADMDFGAIGDLCIFGGRPAEAGGAYGLDAAGTELSHYNAAMGISRTMR